MTNLNKLARIALATMFIVPGSVILVGTASASTTQVSEYAFEEQGVDAVATDTISANNGVAFGEPTPANSSEVPFTTPENLSSAQFNGQNYFQINNNIGNDFTICAWVKTASSGGGEHWTSAPIADSEVGGPARDFGFGINYEGKLIFGNGGLIEGGIVDTAVVGNVVVNNDAWHHLCVTRDGTSGEVKLYADGVLDATGTTGTGPITDNAYIKIASGSDGNSSFVGLIDDFKLFTSVLSAEELALITNPVVDTPETPPTDPTPSPEVTTLADTGSNQSGSDLLPFAAGLLVFGVFLVFMAKRRKNHIISHR